MQSLVTIYRPVFVIMTMEATLMTLRAIPSEPEPVATFLLILMSWLFILVLVGLLVVNLFLFFCARSLSFLFARFVVDSVCFVYN